MTGVDALRDLVLQRGADKLRLGAGLAQLLALALAVRASDVHLLDGMAPGRVSRATAVAFANDATALTPYLDARG